LTLFYNIHVINFIRLFDLSLVSFINKLQPTSCRLTHRSMMTTMMMMTVML